MKRHRRRFNSNFSVTGNTSSTMTQSTLTNGSQHPPSRKLSAFSNFSTYLVNQASCCLQNQQGQGYETPYSERRRNKLPQSTCSFSECQPNLDVSYASHQQPLMNNYNQNQQHQGSYHPSPDPEYGGGHETIYANLLSVHSNQHMPSMPPGNEVVGHQTPSSSCAVYGGNSTVSLSSTSDASQQSVTVLSPPPAHDSNGIGHLGRAEYPGSAELVRRGHDLNSQGQYHQVHSMPTTPGASISPAAVYETQHSMPPGYPSAEGYYHGQPDQSHSAFHRSLSQHSYHHSDYPDPASASRLRSLSRNKYRSDSAPVREKVEAQGEDGVKRTIPIAASVQSGTGSYGGTPPKISARSDQTRVGTPQQGSRNSPAELSPPGYVDSPHSASFTSAQSEIDDIIIDEILSLEDEQNRRRQQNPQMASSYTYSENMANLGVGGGSGRIVQFPEAMGGASGENPEFSRQVSSSAPTSTLDIGGLVNQEFHDYSAATPDDDNSRDRRKKDIHNMIERRRRYNINDRIKELGTLLPKCSTESTKMVSSNFSDMKLNKGTILKASVDYIRSLQREHDNAMRIANKQQQLEQQNRQMAQRIRDLESQLHQNNVPVPQNQPPTSLYNNGPGSLGRHIKEEPPDDGGHPSPHAGSHPGNFFQHTPPHIGSYGQQQHGSQPLSTGQQGGQGSYGSAQGSPLDPVPSPSMGAAAGISQLALDPHTYAASGEFGRQPSGGGYGRQASNSMFNTTANVSLVTPPVQPYSSKPPLQQHEPTPQQMHELIMDLNPEVSGAGHLSGLLHGDPMLGAQGSGQGSSGLSPEHVQWDAAAFSPDGPNEQQMDISS